MKTEKFIKDWGKCRQEGKEKYVHKRSVLIAGGAIIGQSATSLYKRNLMFLDFPNLILIFVMTYIAVSISATYAWKRNEKKYNGLINDTEE